MNIKLMAGAAIVLAIIYFFPAFKHMQSSRAISGDSVVELKKSAMKVRKNMTTNERNSFDTAFGILEKLKAEEGDGAFVKAVSGLEPNQVVDLAKQEVDTKIAAGHPDLKQYASWDDMMTKLTAEAPKKGGHVAQEAAPLRQSERTGRPE
jgi:hypothetical protein